jgi:hypothetical protein
MWASEHVAVLKQFHVLLLNEGVCYEGMSHQ